MVCRRLCASGKRTREALEVSRHLLECRLTARRRLTWQNLPFTGRLRWLKLCPQSGRPASKMCVGSTHLKEMFYRNHLGLVSRPFLEAQRNPKILKLFVWTMSWCAQNSWELCQVILFHFLIMRSYGFGFVRLAGLRVVEHDSWFLTTLDKPNYWA